MLQTTPLTGTLGAKVSNVDLLQHDPQLVDEIKHALREYKVLVIPGQETLTPDALLSFAENFGTAERAEHPNWDDVPGHVGVKLLDTRNYPSGPGVGDSWHTDGATRDSTQWFSFLHAKSVPPYGRDTLFADMEAAYQRLSKPLQEFLEGLSALQSWGISKPEAPPVEHPVILTDPDTGRKTLYVNRLYTTRIVGLRDEESDALLELLFRQVSVPELQLRVSWQPGTLTIWDNERTQHYLVRDRQSDRVMHRVMVSTGR
ncbi:MAG: TauD/TfdA family dioxygenase [Gammaproteobacteria bacterium]|nr:TauD/TfdA family dioxygenase [Gammaproteobacteria bacterium]